MRREKGRSGPHQITEPAQLVVGKGSVEGGDSHLRVPAVQQDACIQKLPLQEFISEQKNPFAGEMLLQIPDGGLAGGYNLFARDRKAHPGKLVQIIFRSL